MSQSLEGGDLPEVPQFAADDPRAVTDGDKLGPSGVPDEVSNPAITLDALVPPTPRSPWKSRIAAGTFALATAVLSVALLDSQGAVRRKVNSLLNVEETHLVTITGTWSNAQAKMARLCESRPLPNIGTAGHEFTPIANINDPWCVPTGEPTTVNARIDEIIVDMRRVQDTVNLVRIDRRHYGLDSRKLLWVDRVSMTAAEIIRGLEAAKRPIVAECPDAGTDTVVANTEIVQSTRSTHPVRVRTTHATTVVAAPSQPRLSGVTPLVVDDGFPRGATLRVGVPVRTSPSWPSYATPTAPVDTDTSFGTLTTSNPCELGVPNCLGLRP